MWGRLLAASALVPMLIACQSPRGSEIPTCRGLALARDAVAVQAGGIDPRPVGIDCWREVDRARIQLWFATPAGPSCHHLARVELVESADAISVVLVMVTDDAPNAGACPEGSQDLLTEVDLQAPVGERLVLDAGSAE